MSTNMILSIPEYAYKINKSRHTIYRWIRKNTLPPGVKLKTIGGHLFLET